MSSLLTPDFYSYTLYGSLFIAAIGSLFVLKLTSRKTDGFLWRLPTYYPRFLSHSLQCAECFSGWLAIICAIIFHQWLAILPSCFLSMLFAKIIEKVYDDK